MCQMVESGAAAVQGSRVSWRGERLLLPWKSSAFYGGRNWCGSKRQARLQRCVRSRRLPMAALCGGGGGWRPGWMNSGTSEPGADGTSRSQLGWSNISSGLVTKSTLNTPVDERPAASRVRLSQRGPCGPRGPRSLSLVLNGVRSTVSYVSLAQ